MKILFLQKRPLFPADNGGKIRTLNILRHLAEWHDVTYLCNLLPEEQLSCSVQKMEELGVRVVAIPWNESSRQSVRFYAELAANCLNSRPYNVEKDFDERLRHRAQELLNAEGYDLVICDFVQMAANAIGLNGPPMLLFQHNVEAEIFERHAQQDRGVLRRAFMGYQARKMSRFEGQAGLAFDAVIAVSDRDSQQYAQRYGWNHVHTIDTAVDVDFYQPDASTVDPDLVIFVGSMDWLPNVDGVEFLVREIWPKVRSERPHARLQIVGRHPTPAVRRLNGFEGIEVTGAVRDVRPYYRQAAVVVVPLRIGGGTRIKIYEAMAMAKPVISTSIGAEGLNFIEDKHLEIADQSKLFAEKVVRLLNDDKRRQQIGDEAREHVRQNFSTQVIARQFEKICLGISRTDDAHHQHRRCLPTVGQSAEGVR